MHKCIFSYSWLFGKGVKGALTYFAVFIFLLSPALVMGQHADFQVSVTHYSVENGLSSREVFCAVQDNDGFIWLGTRNGLCRFDGKSFKLFTKQSHGLYDNRVIQIVKDDAGRFILVYGHPNQIRATMKLEVFDPRTFQVSSIAPTYPDWKFKEEHVIWITNDGDGIAVLTNNPVKYWHLSKSKDEGFDLTPYLSEKDWLDKKVNSAGARLTGFGHHCQFYKGSVIFNHKPTRAFVGDTILALGADIKLSQFTAEGNLIARDNSLNFWKIGENGSREPWYQNLVAADFLAIVHGNSHEVFTSDHTHGIRLMTGEEVIPILSADKTHYSSWAGIYNYFKDHTGAYWICTSGGLYRVVIQKRKFKNYFTRSDLNLARDNQARGIVLDEQQNLTANLWTTTYQVNLLSAEKRFFQHERESIQYGLALSNGKLYSAGLKLHVFNPTSLKLLQSVPIIDFNEIWTIFPWNDTTLLLGARSIHQIFNPITNHFKIIGKSQDRLIDPSVIYRFIPKSRNENWAIAQNGIFILNIRDHVFSSAYSKQSQSPEFRLPFEIIHDACLIGDDMWVATNGEGLYRWSLKKHQFTRYSKNEGLPSDILYRLEADNFNHLWISTDNGLARMSLSDFTFNIFSDKDGLPHNEFNRGSSFKASSGKLYFGGLNGVTELNPADFLEERQHAIDPLRIVALNQFTAGTGKLIDKTLELLSIGRIVLNPGDRFFTLDFRLLDYNEGAKKYAYQIEGLDADWILLAEPTIRINGLYPGEYKLKIKGQNSSGLWSEDMLIIPITVKAPIWQKRWFQLLMIAVFTVLLFLIFKWRTRQLEATKQALERTVENRTQQLKVLLEQKELMMKEIHHRVKNNLQVISSLLRLQQERSSDETTQRALQESQNRVLSIAFLHQNLYQHDDLKGVFMKDFIPEMCSHIQDVYVSDTSHIKVDFLIDNILLHIDKAVPLGLIINELLTNSFKYAFQHQPEGLISIQFEEKGDGKYCFRYRDNGPGLPDGTDWKRSKSLGLKLIHQLSRQLGGMIEYQYDDGTVFYLEFSSMENE